VHERAPLEQLVHRCYLVQPGNRQVWHQPHAPGTNLKLLTLQSKSNRACGVAAERDATAGDGKTRSVEQVARALVLVRTCYKNRAACFAQARGRQPRGSRPADMGSTSRADTWGPGCSTPEHAGVPQ